MTDEIAEKIRRRQRFANWWIPAFLVDPFRRCPHERQRGIYGDEILQTMNVWTGSIKRASCLDCGRLLPHLPPGPVGNSTAGNLDEPQERKTR